MANHIRKKGKTPAGGDYSEIYFFDDEENIVDESVATRCIIRECLKDGTLVQETFGFIREKDGSMS